jgi:hypothetical protein
MKERRMTLAFAAGLMGCLGALLASEAQAGPPCPTDTCSWIQRALNEVHWGCCEVWVPFEGYRCKEVYSFTVACVVPPESPFVPGTGYRFVDGNLATECVGGDPAGCV